jgi:hypothetical protein
VTGSASFARIPGAKGSGGSGRRRRCAARVLAALLLQALARSSLGAPPEPGAGPTEDTKAEARKHFDRGLVLFDAQAWDAALAEFILSNDLYPTRSAVKNVALCLRKLKRHDEALESFERLLAFPALSAEDQELARREIAALRELVGSILIQAAEASATITVDGRQRGTTPAPGPLRVMVGSHTVRIYKEGFEPFEVRIQVAGEQSVVVRARLTPSVSSDRRAPDPRTPLPVAALQDAPGPGRGHVPPPASGDEGRFFLEATGAFGLAPSFGGDVEVSCAKPCSKPPDFGLVATGRGGYHFPSGVELGIDAGFAQVRQEMKGRPAFVEPVGLPRNPGTADDTRSLRAAVVGASAAVRLGDGVAASLQLGAGALLGQIEDHRTGAFSTVTRPSKPSVPYSVNVTESRGFGAFYLGPEARAVMRMGRSVEVSAGIKALVVVTPDPPSWAPDKVLFPAATDGLGKFPEEKLSGSVVALIGLGLGVRYEF